MMENACKWLVPLGFLLVFGGAAQAVPLQMHRAVYDLSLGRTEAASDIAGLDGRMVTEWRGGPACGGYTSTQRVVTRVTALDQSYMSNDIRLSYFEAANGGEFTYTRSEYTNGELTDQEDGTASRLEDGKISLLREGGVRRELPSGVLFPVQYHRTVIERAERGERVFELTLFDGTEERENPTTVFILKQRPETSEVPPEGKGAEVLKDVAHWPARISYFDKEGGDGMPNFEMGMMLYANGIATDIRLDYIDIEIRARLKELTIFEDGAC
ncbi:MAG: cell envelope integrity EipB family protein [Parvibaculum sp.]|nr:cell envelope integrity EipB family protein [Parvibaculum sp.]